MKTWLLIFSLMIALAQLALAGGSSVGNGETLVIDGTTYQVADLHFVPLPFDRYQFDEALTQKLKSMAKFLEQRFRGTRILGGAGRSQSVELFEDDIFNPLVEYRLVKKLPAGCTFIPDENLPFVKTKVPGGCTMGKLTYLTPDYISSLKDLDQKALFIIHERMNALFKDEPYDLKVDVIKALHVLTGRYQKAYEARDTSFVLTDKEYAVVKLLPHRLNQLYGIHYLSWDIAPEGGVAEKIEGEDIHADILSSAISLKGRRVFLHESSVGNISGNDVTVIRSKLADTGYGSAALELRDSEQVSVVDSTLVGRIWKSKQINIERMNIPGLLIESSSRVRLSDIQASKVVIKDSEGVTAEKVDFERSRKVVGTIEVTQSKKVDLRGLSEVRSPESDRWGAFILNIQGEGIAIADTRFEPIPTHSYCWMPNVLRPQSESHGFTGSRIRVVNGLFRTTIAKAAERDYCVYGLGSLVQGSDIELNEPELQGARIEGSQIRWGGARLETKYLPGKGAYPEVFLAHLQGNNVDADSSLQFTPGTQSVLENVHVHGFSYDGFSLDTRKLKDIRVSNVRLVASQSETPLSILPGTELRNIAELRSDRSIVFGTSGAGSGSALIDGEGRRYRVGKGSLFNRGPVQIGSSQDLSRWGD